jgi:hypothetical protein
MRRIKESAPLKFKRVELVLVVELPVVAAVGAEATPVSPEPIVPVLAVEGVEGASDGFGDGVVFGVEDVEGARVKPGGRGLVWL